MYQMQPSGSGTAKPEPPSCSLSSAAVVTTVLHQFAESLGNAVDAKDSHTRRHSDEVAELAHALALRLGVPPVSADIIHVAAHLHDVGKIGIPDAILRKPGPLTPEETHVIRKHPEIGAEIVRPVRQLSESGVLEVILHHHERWDGGGYPHGLRGQAIPLGARIVALADSLSAMLQARPYRAALTFSQACREIKDQSGRQFDPQVARVFLSMCPTIECLVHALRYDQEKGQEQEPAPDPDSPTVACAEMSWNTF